MAFDRVVPHSDGAGVVEAVGKGADPAMVGRRVIRNGRVAARRRDCGAVHRA